MKAALMAIATKLIGAYALTQSAAHTEATVKRFLAGLALVLITALVGGVLAGAVLVGAHILLYVALTTIALLSPVAALSITLGVAIALTVGIVMLLSTRAKELFDMPQKMNFTPPPANEESIETKLGNIADAFMQGLKHGRSPR